MTEPESGVARRPDDLAEAGPGKLLAARGKVKVGPLPGPPLRTRARCAGLLAALLLAGPIMACGDRERPAVVAARPTRPSPALRLVALTDLAGALEPCGCQSRPLGGLDKAAGKLAELRADKTPLLLVAAGDLWFGNTPEGAPPGIDASAQEIAKAETISQILGQLGAVAVTPGPRDLTYGRQTLERLAASASFRVLPDPAHADADKPARTTPSAAGETTQPASAARAVSGFITTVGNTSVGLVGVSTLFLERTLDSAQQRELQEAGQREVDGLRKQGAQVVVALLSTDQRLGRRLSGAWKDVDFVVQGGLDHVEAPPPSRAGDAVILRASHNGQGLLVVDLYPRTDSAFVDISAWTRREQSERLNGQIRELGARIEGWQRDPSVDKKSLDEQRAKLLALEAEAKGLERPGDASAAAFDARFEELAPEVQPDARIGAVMDAYDARINQHNRVAFANVRAPEAPPGSAHYAGSDACRSCHSAAHAWWTTTAHGRAYTTLETRHKQWNLSCVGCHVTGYNQPGGSAVVQNEGLVHVGCESCHGPGSEHIAHPDTEPPPFVTRSPTASVCVGCHNPEHSDRFQFDSYVARLRAPGHGLPVP